MRPNRYPLLTLLIAGSYTGCRGQELPSVTPAPREARQAVTLDLIGNTPFVGVSYHYELIRFNPRQNTFAGAVEVQAGVGYIPQFCFFNCSPGGLTTHHALLLLWGNRLRGEFGYAGTLTEPGLFGAQAYMPGALIGLRTPSGKTWLVRLYVAGLIYHTDGTVTTATGDLVRERKTVLLVSPGLSIGKRF